MYSSHSSDVMHTCVNIRCKQTSQKMFLFTRDGSECPNKIMYAKAKAASSILLSCATSYDCFNTKTIKKYNKNPNKME